MRGRLSVLVVDDDLLSRETTTQLLRNAGYSAGSAEDADIALARLQQSAWDVVLTDVRMPRMDGLELMKKIKRSWPDVEVILMTGDPMAAVSVGERELLTKPFKFRELDGRLKELVNLRETRRRLNANERPNDPA